jgi:7-carboxy-7-deazaguanine synthase (Cx14CxxC type)
MPYRVKEIFRSLCGEGSQSGRAAVFVRFAGCNGWNGLPAGRQRGPLGCSAWCDTDFNGTNGLNGGTYETAIDLERKIEEVAGGCPLTSKPWCVLTGGEPALQVDSALIAALRSRGFGVQIETNGTLPIPSGIDFVTVSPKPGGTLVVASGDELKLVYPTLDPRDFEAMPFGAFYLQPMAGPFLEANTTMARDYCLNHPTWRLGLQLHKTLGIN